MTADDDASLNVLETFLFCLFVMTNDVSKPDGCAHVLVECLRFYQLFTSCPTPHIEGRHVLTP